MAIKVRNNMSRIHRVEGVTLTPGLNSVAEDNWKKVKSNPAARVKIERGMIEEVSSKADKEPSAAELAKEIPEIYDMERLKELADDGRKKVAEAAQAQIDKINAAAGESQ